MGKTGVLKNPEREEVLLDEIEQMGLHRTLKAQDQRKGSK